MTDNLEAVPTPEQNLHAITEALRQHAEGAITVSECFAKVALIASEAWGQVRSSVRLHPDEFQSYDEPETQGWLSAHGLTLDSTDELNGALVVVGTRADIEQMFAELGFVDFNDTDYEAGLSRLCLRIKEFEPMTRVAGTKALVGGLEKFPVVKGVK